MDSVITNQYVSKSAAGTEKLGRSLGKQLRGGEVIELIGDLGSGKTTFVRGLARGLGSNNQVTSPTFTICKIYKGRLSLYHYDFYRLQDDFTVKNELTEIAKDKSAVAAIEWGGDLKKVIPTDYITVRISVISENERSFDTQVPLVMGYLKMNLV